jgi:hypothetical protein
MMGNYLLAGLNLNINALHSVTGAPVVSGKITNLNTPDLVN